MKYTPTLATLGVCLAAVTAESTATRAAEPDISTKVIAVQLRKQGFECKNPENAKRTTDTATDEPVWIIACEGVSYKVELIPKQAAKVERIAAEQETTEQTASPPPPQ